jgi:hypothetical protein
MNGKINILKIKRMSCINTRIASQRNQYVLLQVGVDTQQEDIAVKDRFTFLLLIVSYKRI